MNPCQASRPPRLLAQWSCEARCFLIIMALLGEMTAGWGHDLFNAYIQHRVALTVGRQHLDVTVVLTFFEDSSEHERDHMDANGDGKITRAEIEAYMREFEPRWFKAVTLRQGDCSIALTPLREPEVDLLGNDKVGRGHHRLTLFYFASTPPDLNASAELIIENRLWPDARALVALHVEGRDGFRIETLARTDPVHPRMRAGEAREFRATIVSFLDSRTKPTFPEPKAFPPVERSSPESL